MPLSWASSLRTDGVWSTSGTHARCWNPRHAGFGKRIVGHGPAAVEHKLSPWTPREAPPPETRHRRTRATPTFPTRGGRRAAASSSRPHPTLLGRHRTLSATLHTGWALTVGLGITLFARERYELVLWVVLFLALHVGVHALLRPASAPWKRRATSTTKARGAAGPPGLVHEVTSYLTRIMYQETLFFLLPSTRDPHGRTLSQRRVPRAPGAARAPLLHRPALRSDAAHARGVRARLLRRRGFRRPQPPPPAPLWPGATHGDARGGAGRGRRNGARPLTLRVAPRTARARMALGLVAGDGARRGDRLPQPGAAGAHPPGGRHLRARHRQRDARDRRHAPLPRVGQPGGQLARRARRGFLGRPRFPPR